MRGVQIVGIHRQQPFGGRNDAVPLVRLHVNGKQLLVDPGDGGRLRIFGDIFFEQSQLARLRRFLFDSLQQQAVLGFRIGVQLVPVRRQRVTR